MTESGQRAVPEPCAVPEERATPAERVLDGLPPCRPPPEGQFTPAYRPVEVYDESGRPWPATVTGWWTSPEGAAACRLRLADARTPRWTPFDTDRIVPLVQGGT
ncbi:hypothetical protein OK074_0306 [Actinobacteria bacterium OK074]|nr:hypothetical protein OK074_0306 [Actinobacteria bacterium OK074]